MKKYAGIVSVILFLGLGWSCRHNQKGFVLTGILREKPGEKIILKRQVDLEKWIDADSTTVNNEGVFEFRGRIEYPEFVYVYLTGRNKFIRFFLENSQIRILKRYDSILLQPWVGGSATQDTFRNFRGALQAEFMVPMHQLSLQYKRAKKDNDSLAMKNILGERDSLMTSQQKFEKDFIITHANSVLAPFMISISYLNYTPGELDSLMSILDPALDSSLYVKISAKRIKYRKMSLPGNPAPEISLPDTSGKIYSLRDWTGKYLLLNFWASWNQRSITLSEQILPVYGLYHEQGFDILGISLDTNPREWKAAVSKNRFPWVQVIESSGPRGDVPARYNITGFPQMVVIDPEGIIQARVEDIPELEELLFSVFK